MPVGWVGEHRDLELEPSWAERSFQAVEIAAGRFREEAIVRAYLVGYL